MSYSVRMLFYTRRINTDVLHLPEAQPRVNNVREYSEYIETVN